MTTTTTKATAATTTAVSTTPSTGPIPPSLGNLTSLHSLRLNRNSLEGAIPASLCRLPFLTVLDAAFNNLSGAIPPSICNLSTIQRQPRDTEQSRSCPSRRHAAGRLHRASQKAPWLRHDHFEKKRKEAREVHKRPAMAQKALGIKGKMFAKKRYAEKALMKKNAGLQD